jgi:hypothetical protein
MRVGVRAVKGAMEKGDKCVPVLVKVEVCNFESIKE